MVVFNYLKHLDAWEVKYCLEHTCADQYIEEKEKENEKEKKEWFDSETKE